MNSNINSVRTVGFFVTCLANTMRPSLGFAAIQLLEQAGCQVDVPERQSCCGQPAFNSGDDAGTRRMAKQFIEVFENYQYVVAPSGSCANMVKKNFVEVFEKNNPWRQRAQSLADKTWELLSFLVDICDFVPKNVRLEGTYTYHDSCSGLRGLGIEQQPRKLLSHIDGLNYLPLKKGTECCGFGGTFCVKYSNISNSIVDEKAKNIVNTQADYLLGGDMGCLMNMAGKLKRQNHTKITTLHTAEVLAGMARDLSK